MGSTKDAQDNVVKSLDSVTGDPESGVVGLVFCSVDKVSKTSAPDD